MSRIVGLNSREMADTILALVSIQSTGTRTFKRHTLCAAWERFEVIAVYEGVA